MRDALPNAPVEVVVRRGFIPRVLGFPLTQIVIALLFTLGPVFALRIGLSVPRAHEVLERALPDPDLRKLILDPLFVVLMLVGYYLHARWIERRPLTEFSLRGALPEFAAGLVLGAALLSATVGILAALGVYRVTGTNSWGIVLVPLVVMVAVGFSEEIVFRGIVFRILERSLGSWTALALSSLLFGALHLGNPNATWVSCLTITIEAGVLLVAAYLLTRRLWLCIGIHIAWNFTQGSIFSVPVSGLASEGVWSGKLEGPTWLTGGDFGVEASVVAFVLCTAAGLTLLGMAVRRGHMVLPFWRRTRSGPAPRMTSPLVSDDAVAGR